MPESGQIFAALCGAHHDEFMADPDLVRHIAYTTGLPENVAARVVEDVLAYYSETVQEYVHRRHQELQRYGTRNDKAFRIITEELAARRVKAPELSVRQVGRMIYG